MKGSESYQDSESRIHSSLSPNPSSTRGTNGYIQSKDFFILFPNRLLRDTSHFIHNFVRDSYNKLLWNPRMNCLLSRRTVIILPLI
ncbi:hypothetical protein Y032_0008g225 [Ancylostoma ceylanicum]|uniref:Uncharacterized protein n=1 Tax=Ancylostoma ceylanicum TaxID=53326 RepID=A0A016VLG0_9BILA|nr:hypothetical protein Y032_0008g225 [Ancylostoma ceylanicum]